MTYGEFFQAKTSFLLLLNVILGPTALLTETFLLILKIQVFKHQDMMDQYVYTLLLCEYV